METLASIADEFPFPNAPRHYPYAGRMTMKLAPIPYIDIVKLRWPVRRWQQFYEPWFFIWIQRMGSINTLRVVIVDKLLRNER